MSILKSIKGTLKTVQDDFSEGLKSITSVPEKPPSQERLNRVQKSVHFDAGGELLHRNEEIWKDLYTYSDNTAKRAQSVDIDIAKLLVQYEKQCDLLTRFHQEAANLPILLTQLQDITNTLAQVEEEYDKVEVGLVHLENLCEELDFQREKRSHHNQLAVYKMKKEHEVQRYKVQLAREHASKVQQLEKKREQLLKERQSAYEEQFSSDVDFYRKHGKLERLPSTPEREKKLDIADVEIEEDPSALDDFLASSTSDVVISGDPSENTEPTEQSDDDNDGQEEQNIEVIPEVTSSTPISSTEVISPENSTSGQSSPLDGKDSISATEQQGTDSADFSNVDSDEKNKQDQGDTK